MKATIKDIIREGHVTYLRGRAARSTVLDVARRGPVLIVAPHPDDEVIGCGGLIARLVAEGNAPNIVVMTGGEGSHEHCCNIPKTVIIKARRGLTRKALAILGVPKGNIHELEYPDGGISIENQQTEVLKGLIEQIHPQSVFVSHWGEGWSDHVNTAEIVKSIVSTNITIYEYCVWMWYYNVWHGLDWKNACSLKMTPEEHELKLQAMHAYIKPLAPCGKPWSGVLPPLFIKANKWDKELFFKVK